jgi:hypothetical protein
MWSAQTSLHLAPTTEVARRSAGGCLNDHVDGYDLGGHDVPGKCPAILDDYRTICPAIIRPWQVVVPACKHRIRIHSKDQCALCHGSVRTLLCRHGRGPPRLRPPRLLVPELLLQCHPLVRLRQWREPGPGIDRVGVLRAQQYASQAARPPDRCRDLTEFRSFSVVFIGLLGSTQPPATA